MNAPTERQARTIWLALTGLALALIVALVAALIWGLGQILSLLSPVIWPLAMAGILACLLDPVVDFIERTGASRVRAILCVFALALVIAAALASSVVPQVIKETRQFAERIPDYADWVQIRVEKWISNRTEFVRKFLEKQAGPSTTAPSAGTNEAALSVSTNT